MTAPLAKVLLANREARCGVAVARCFPDAPKVQAALAEYDEAFRDIVDETAADFVGLIEYLAEAHGLVRMRDPAAPAIGLAVVLKRQTFTLYDGRHWWALGVRGIGVVPPRCVLVAYEVA